MATAQIPYLDHRAIATALDHRQAADALAEALRGGLDPGADPPRSSLALPRGELLVMASQHAGTAVTKLVTVGGSPRIQGLCVVFDPQTLAPVALLDGVGLTTLRTAAVSLLALRSLAAPGASRLLVFGTGAQAQAHVAAITAELPITRTDLIGSAGHPQAAQLVAAADVICCCTTAGRPLFHADLVGTRAAVVAVGSHAPDRRELPTELLARATVVVEEVPAALREAGDVVMAVASGSLRRADLVELGDVVRGDHRPDPARPAVFKSVGMAWQDAVVATAVLRAAVA